MVTASSVGGAPHQHSSRAAAFFCAHPGPWLAPRRHCTVQRASGGLVPALRVPAVLRRHACTWTALDASTRGGRGSEVDATLLTAIEDGDALAVQSALASGANPAATDDWGTACLQTAVKKGHTEVLIPRACAVSISLFLCVLLSRDVTRVGLIRRLMGLWCCAGRAPPPSRGR